MHAIGTFIDEDRDGGVRSGIGNVLDHLFHDEGIADHEPYDLGRLGSGLATQNAAEVEFHEKHQTRAAEAALHDTLQIGEGSRSLRRSEKLDHVGLPDRRLERGHDGVERL
jgi:hypothetical protein